MEDKDIIKALEWCEQFENNIVMSNRSGEKFILALQAMQIIKQALKEHTCQKAEIERLKTMHSEMCIGMKVLKKTTIKEYKEKVIEILLGKGIFPVLVKNALNEVEKKMTEGRENG